MKFVVVKGNKFEVFLQKPAWELLLISARRKILFFLLLQTPTPSKQVLLTTLLNTAKETGRQVRFMAVGVVRPLVVVVRLSYCFAVLIVDTEFCSHLVSCVFQKKDIIT